MKKCSNYYSRIMTSLQNNKKQMYKRTCSKGKVAEVETIINGNVKDSITIFKDKVEERMNYDKLYIANLGNFMPIIRNILLNISLEIPSIYLHYYILDLNISNIIECFEQKKCMNGFSLNYELDNTLSRVIADFIREISFTINKFEMAYEDFKKIINKVDVITINPPNFDINIYDFANIFPGGINLYFIIY